MHPGQGAAGCYQQSFQQNSMDTSHDTTITHNGNPIPLFCYWQHFIIKEHINITKIPITPSLYTNKMPESIKDANSKKGKEKDPLFKHPY
jgi:hypothetical protein